MTIPRHDEKKIRKKSAFKLTLRLLLVAVAIAVIRILLPTQTFAALPTYLSSGIEALPYWLAAIVLLGISLPREQAKPLGYLTAALLLVPATLGYNALYQWLFQAFPRVTALIDIWSLQAIALYALRPLLLGIAQLLLFLLLWKLSFATFPWRRLRVSRLIRPVPLLLFILGCLVVSYCHMVNYAQINAGPIYGMLFAAGPPKSAVWYHLPPLPNLVIYWIAQPLEALVLCLPLRSGMLMILSSYPPKVKQEKPEKQ